MWLFVAKPLLNAKNGHGLYVLYDICPCNQYFRVKFILSNLCVSQPQYYTQHQSRYVDPCFTQTHPFSPNQLTILGFPMQIPILMIMAYIIAIHGEKRPMNLVLISQKYSQRNTNLGIKFCHRCENLFSLQSEG